jgi:hypothetical protein
MRKHLQYTCTSVYTNCNFVILKMQRPLKRSIGSIYKMQYLSKFIYWIMPLEIALMYFSYATCIMIFNIMIFEFHSAWNSHYWNFIIRETVIIEIVIRHGTQKPKFDFRFGMALRKQNMTSGLAGKARDKL